MAEAEKENVVCEGRIVLTDRTRKLVLRTVDGSCPLEYALVCYDFQPGDRVEVRLVERDPQWGLTQWSATARRG